MTIVTYDKNKNELLVKGHAGNDSVCAAVSALCIALEHRMRELIQNVDSFGNNGVYGMRIGSRSYHAEEALRTVLAGFRELARMYPNNINITEV